MTNAINLNFEKSLKRGENEEKPFSTFVQHNYSITWTWPKYQNVFKFDGEISKQTAEINTKTFSNVNKNVSTISQSKWA